MLTPIDKQVRNDLLHFQPAITKAKELFIFKNDCAVKRK